MNPELLLRLLASILQKNSTNQQTPAPTVPVHRQDLRQDEWDMVRVLEGASGVNTKKVFPKIVQSQQPLTGNTWGTYDSSKNEVDLNRYRAWLRNYPLAHEMGHWAHRKLSNDSLFYAGAKLGDTFQGGTSQTDKEKREAFAEMFSQGLGMATSYSRGDYSYIPPGEPGKRAFEMVMQLLLSNQGKK